MCTFVYWTGYVLPFSDSTMSMEELRQNLRVEDVLHINRVEDGESGLLLVVLHEKQEISGVKIDNYVNSFPLMYSVLQGRMSPNTDLPLLIAKYPQYSWLTFGEVLQQVAQMLSTATKSDIQRMVAEILSLVVAKDVADSVRKKLGPKPEMIVDLLNGDVAAVDKGRVMIGCLWFHMAVARWVAKRNGKDLSWQLAVQPDKLVPVGTFVSEPKLQASLAGCWPKPDAPIPSVAAIMNPDLPKRPEEDVSGSNSSGGPAGPEMGLPTAEAELLTMAEVLKKVIAAVEDVPKDKMPMATGHLETLLSSFKSTQGLTIIMKRITDAAQLSSCLSSFAWPIGAENVRVRAVLLAWLKYLQTSGATEANPAAKSKYLSEILTILHKANSATEKGLDWPDLACQFAVGLLAISEEAAKVFPVEKVKDWPTFADAIIPALSVFSQAPQLRALVDLARKVTVSGDKPSWAADVLKELQASLGGPAKATDASLVMRSDLAESDQTLVKVSLDGTGTVPWPVFLTAVSVFVGCNVPALASAESQKGKGRCVHQLTVRVPTSQLQAVAKHRKKWQLPIGAGSTVTMEILENPLNPPKTPPSSHNMSALWALGEVQQSPTEPSKGSKGGKSGKQGWDSWAWDNRSTWERQWERPWERQSWGKGPSHEPPSLYNDRPSKRQRRDSPNRSPSPAGPEDRPRRSDSRASQRSVPRYDRPQHSGSHHVDRPLEGSAATHRDGNGWRGPGNL